jgi:hypothetical protein
MIKRRNEKFIDRLNSLSKDPDLKSLDKNELIAMALLLPEMRKTADKKGKNSDYDKIKNDLDIMEKVIIHDADDVKNNDKLRNDFRKHFDYNDTLMYNTDNMGMLREYTRLKKHKSIKPKRKPIKCKCK